MDDIFIVAEKLKSAKRVLFTTGAGISVDSGIPTYRGVGGLYDDSFSKDGVNIAEVLTGMMIRKNPHIVWEYLSRMEKMCRDAKPNEAHHLISRLQEKMSVVVFTQNVDGLHQQSGSKNVIDIHGTFRKLYCMNIECEYTEDVENYSHLSIPPICPICSNILRPSIILFGEMLPGKKLVDFAKEMEQSFDIAIAIGTTGTFPYITGPLFKLKAWGAFVAEINPDNTPISDQVDISIRAGATPTLQKIWEIICQS